MTAEILQHMAGAFMKTAEAQGRRAQESFAQSDITTYQAQRVNAQLFHDLASAFSVAAAQARAPSPFSPPPERFEPSQEPVEAIPGGQAVRGMTPEEIAEKAAEEVGEVIPIVKAPVVHKAQDDVPRPPAHTPVQVGDDGGPSGEGSA